MSPCPPKRGVLYSPREHGQLFSFTFVKPGTLRSLLGPDCAAW